MSLGKRNGRRHGRTNMSPARGNFSSTEGWDFYFYFSQQPPSWRNKRGTTDLYAVYTGFGLETGQIWIRGGTRRTRAFVFRPPFLG